MAIHEVVHSGALNARLEVMAVRNGWEPESVGTDEAYKVGLLALDLDEKEKPDRGWNYDQWLHEITVNAAYALQYSDITQYTPEDLDKLRSLASKYHITALAYLANRVPDFGNLDRGFL